MIVFNGNRDTPVGSIRAPSGELTCNAPEMIESCRLPFPDDMNMALRHPRSIRVHEQWIAVNPCGGTPR